MRFKDVLEKAQKSQQNRAGILILAQELLGASKQKLLTFPEAAVDAAAQKKFEAACKELEDGRPVQYILGKWEFCGRTYFVSEGVLIPREDTLTVCKLAAEFLKGKSKAVFADLGSGSGCIAVTLALETGAEGYAIERSEKAFVFLKKNCMQAEGKVKPVSGDMFSKEILEDLPLLDLVVSNPPYIAESEVALLSPQVRREPNEALFGGKDGLDYYRKITAVYKDKLRYGAAVAFEVGFRQADDVVKILENAGFENIKVQKDLSNIKRAVIAVNGGKK